MATIQPLPDAKTVRFTALVNQYGRPELVNLWLAPDENKEFSRALRAGRVMSVRQENVGTKRDVGSVGFMTGKTVSYFVFPKPVKLPPGTKVVGIKYELLAASESRPARAPRTARRPPKVRH